MLKFFQAANKEKFWEIFKWVFLGAAALLFLGWKLTHLVYRFGDGNVYMYMAEAVLKGQVPYRNFFFADPPMLLLLLVLVKLLIGNHILWFGAVPVVFEAATSLLLAALLRRWGNPLFWFAPVVYLFSFSVLSTSDYLTGVQVVVFFLMLGIYFGDISRPFWSGVAFSLAFLTKLYAAPAFLGLLLYVLYKKEYKILFYASAGAFFGVLIFWAPFWVISFRQVLADNIIHNLHRPPGLSKAAVYLFFWQREWLLLIFGALGAFTLPKPKRILLWAFVPSVIFLLLYQDLYYNYLDILLPFLAIFVVSFWGFIWQRFKSGIPFALGLMAVYVLFLLSSCFLYVNSYYADNRFLNAEQVAAAAAALPEPFDFYGSHEVAPLIALLAHKNLSLNYIDTNTQSFASGAQNMQLASALVTEQGTYLLAKITDLPQYGVKDFGYEGYYDKNQFEKYCRQVVGFPSTSGEQDNLIAIYRCKS